MICLLFFISWGDWESNDRFNSGDGMCNVIGVIIRVINVGAPPCRWWLQTLSIFTPIHGEDEPLFWRSFSSWVFQLDSKLSAKKHPTNKQRKTQNQWDFQGPPIIMGPLTHTHYSHITPTWNPIIKEGVVIPLIFPNVPQSSLGILMRVPQEHLLEARFGAFDLTLSDPRRRAVCRIDPRIQELPMFLWGFS